MIHDVAIWKLVLGGLFILFVGAAVGFVMAALFCASSKDEMATRAFKDRFNSGDLE